MKIMANMRERLFCLLSDRKLVYVLSVSVLFVSVLPVSVSIFKKAYILIIQTTGTSFCYYLFAYDIWKRTRWTVWLPWDRWASSPGRSPPRWSWSGAPRPPTRGCYYSTNPAPTRLKRILLNSYINLSWNKKWVEYIRGARGVRWISGLNAKPK